MIHGFPTTRLVKFLRANPGATTMEIAVATRTSCAVVGAGLRLLRAEGRVRSAGNTKGMRYYAK